MQDSHKTQTQTATSLPPPLGLAETGGHLCRHTHDTLYVHKHAHGHGSLVYWHGPSVPPVPLPRSRPSDPPHGSPTRWLVHLGAPCKQAALMHLSCRHPTLAHFPRCQHGPSAHLIPQSGPEAPLVTGWSSLKFAGECTCAPRAHQLWGRYRHSQSLSLASLMPVPPVGGFQDTHRSPPVPGGRHPHALQ